MTAAGDTDDTKAQNRSAEFELEPESVKDLDVEDVAAEQVLGGQSRTTKPAEPV